MGPRRVRPPERADPGPDPAREFYRARRERREGRRVELAPGRDEGHERVVPSASPPFSLSETSEQTAGGFRIRFVLTTVAVFRTSVDRQVRGRREEVRRRSKEARWKQQRRSTQDRPEAKHLNGQTSNDSVSFSKKASRSRVHDGKRDREFSNCPVSRKEGLSSCVCSPHVALSRLAQPQAMYACCTVCDIRLLRIELVSESKRRRVNCELFSRVDFPLMKTRHSQAPETRIDEEAGGKNAGVDQVQFEKTFSLGSRSESLLQTRTEPARRLPRVEPESQRTEFPLFSLSAAMLDPIQLDSTKSPT